MGWKTEKKLYRTIRADEEVVAISIPIYVFEEHDGVEDYPIQHPNNKGKIFLHIRMGLHHQQRANLGEQATYFSKR